MLVSILSRSTVVAFGWTESGFARSIIDGTPRTRRCTCRTGNPHVFFAPLAHGQAHIFAPPLASSPRPPGVEAAPLTETVFSAVVDKNAQSPVAWTCNPHVFFAPLAHGQAHIFATSPASPQVSKRRPSQRLCSALWWTITHSRRSHGPRTLPGSSSPSTWA